MSHSPICIMITILIYLGAMLYIGIRCSKSSNTVDDFYLGGRKLGPVVTAMSAEASDMSQDWRILLAQQTLFGQQPAWQLVHISIGSSLPKGCGVFLKHWMLLHYHSSFSKDFAVKTGQSAALQQS